jgi:restriction system protein
MRSFTDSSKLSGFGENRNSEIPKHDQIELYQRWVVLTHPKKVSGFSDSFIKYTDSIGLFDIRVRQDLDVDSEIQKIRCSLDKSGNKYDPKTIRVREYAVMNYARFLEFIEEVGVSALAEISVKQKSERVSKNKISAEEEEKNEEIAAELLERVRNMDPYKFEELLGELFTRMGYGECTITPKSRDGGVDGIISRDALDLEKIVFQAKRYGQSNKVNQDAVQRLVGSIKERGATFGVLITTGYFQSSAVGSAKYNNNLRLVDCEELVELLIKYKVAVKVKRTVELLEVDLNYFELES